MKAMMIRQHFYKYISKAEYAMGYSIVVGTITTSLVTGYSNYLSDRNKRIERINKTPLNHIWVDYISYEDYQKMIDKRNWKPASMRMQNSQEGNNSKKEQILSILNKWLISQTKQQEYKNEIDAEILKQLATANSINTQQSNTNTNTKSTEQLQTLTNAQTEDNNTQKTQQNDANNNQPFLQPTLPIKNSTSVQQQNKKYQIIESVSKIGSLSGVKNKNVLPPSKKEIPQPKYFVVQEAGGYTRYSPKQFKLHHQKQNIELNIKGAKQKVGTIAGKDIEKDESIFQSLAHIWRAILYKDTKKYGQVIDGRYDQYGNRIKTNIGTDVRTQRKQKKQTTAKTTSNEQAQQTIEYIIDDAELAKDKENKENDVKKETIKFIVPTFVIDGNLQKIDENSDWHQFALQGDISTFDVQMLSYLEYTLENCWYQKFKQKYDNTAINATFEAVFNKDKQIIDAQIKSIDENIDKQQQVNFVKDVANMLTRCDISGTKNLSKENYNLWGKIRIKFVNQN